MAYEIAQPWEQNRIAFFQTKQFRFLENYGDNCKKSPQDHVDRGQARNR